MSHTQVKEYILYVSLARIDIYENYKAFLYNERGRELGVFLFPSAEDARTFADLLLSLKAQAERTANLSTHGS